MRVGVDGAPIDEAEDPADQERALALASLARKRAYLGREFLTWILWASNGGEPLCELEGVGVTVLITGKVVLRGLANEATELAVKGHMSAYSEVVRFAIDRGLLVHIARLRLQWGEHVYEATIDAEALDVRGATLPSVEPSATDPDDEDAVSTDRLSAAEQVGALIDALWAAFMTVRLTPKWARRTVPKIKAWLQEDLTSS